MPYNTKGLRKDVDGRPTPQYFNPQTDDYEPLLGDHGASRVLLWGPNDQPLLTEQNPGIVELPDRPDRVLGNVTLSGSTVEPVNGGDAIRTKQVALAYTSWDFQNQEEVTVTAGAQVVDAAREVNGFATLAIIGRIIDTANDAWQVDVRWSGQPSVAINRRAVQLDVIQHDGIFTGTTILPTLSQWVQLVLKNTDTIDHTYHVHALLRI